MYDLTKDYPAITSALRDACGEFAERVDRYGCCGADDVHEVSATSYDGFIAHTNGGFRVMIPCTLRDAESEGLTDFESSVLQGYIDTGHNEVAEQFVTDHYELSELWSIYQDDGGELTALEWFNKRISDAEELHAVQSDLFGNVPFWQTEAGKLREAFYEYSDEWMTEGSTFFYELRVLFYQGSHRRNACDGRDQISVFAGINTDFEYGREKGLETAIERDYKLERLTPARVARIVESFADKL